MKGSTIQNSRAETHFFAATNACDYPLEVWYKRDFVLQKYRPAPLLMNISPDDTIPELQFWNLLREKLKPCFIPRPFDDLSEAGAIVVTPNALRDYTLKNKMSEVRAFNQQVLQSGRTLIAFAGGTEYKPLPGEIVFASSSYSSGSEDCIPTPLWMYDWKSKISPLKKPPIPTVGFVGDTAYRGRLNTLFQNVKIPNSLLIKLACDRQFGRGMHLRYRRIIARHTRRKIVEQVRQAPHLKTTIIERNNGFFNVPVAERERWRQEYIDSMAENAYTLCMRGDENACYQIYEVLSAGRIPIIIDTNLRLPELKGLGNWQEFSVLVPFAELHRIGEIVRDFHDRLSEEAFQQACAQARAAYEYFLPHQWLFSQMESLKEQRFQANISS